MNTITWDEQGQPISTQFDDVYFSKQDGLAETNYVFLKSNQLSSRFEQLADNDTFIIGETGFGTGLNFLATIRLWQTHAPPTAQLHFISTEKYPLHRQDLKKALALWPQLADISADLIEQYPTTINGFHRRVFSHNITLTLIIDDALGGLQALFACDQLGYQSPHWQGVDAWFLDGFAPAKNPQMWQPELFQTMATLSKEGTTLATFTAAGIVKKGLTQAGFRISKVRGFGRKRDMIIGTFTPSTRESDTTNSLNKPIIHNAPWMVINNFTPLSRDKQIAIIGGGIAGCHSAYALAQKGYQVQLFDQENSLAQHASGNAQGVVYAKLSANTEPQGEFNLASLLYAQHHYQYFWQQHPDHGQACGVLQLAFNDKLDALYQNIAKRFSEHNDFVRYLTVEQASQKAHIPLAYSGLFFAKSGWLSPPALCQWLCEHPAITVHVNTPINQLTYADQQWHLSSPQGITTVDGVIIANANDAKTFEQTAHLPTKPIRGQVSHIPVCEHSRPLNTVICAKGYMAPEHQNQHCIGASFNLNSHSTHMDTQDHIDNLAHIDAVSPDLVPAQDYDAMAGRVGFRCTTPDYLPIVGPAPIDSAMREKFAMLRHNAKQAIAHTGQYYPQLFVNIGYGSRGLAYSPLCSQWLADLISGCPTSLPLSLSHKLSPARFIIRDLIRNKG